MSVDMDLSFGFIDKDWNTLEFYLKNTYTYGICFLNSMSYSMFRDITGTTNI